MQREETCQYLKDSVDAIERLDLDPIKLKLMDPDDGHAWPREHADLMEVAYKRYLTLLVKYPERQIVPTKDIDKFWHAHILDTLKYMEDCDRIFGKYLHHFPYFGLRGQADLAESQAASITTADLYMQEFGEPLPKSHAWCIRAEAKPDAAWCIRADKAATDAAWCIRADKTATDAAWCIRADKAATDAAWCIRAEAKPDAAWCIRADKAASDAAWCIRADKAATDAAWCIRAEAKPDAAWCIRADKAATDAAWCIRAGGQRFVTPDVTTRPTLAPVTA